MRALAPGLKPHITERDARMSDIAPALGGRAPNPLAQLLVINRFVVSTLNNMQISHRDFDPLAALVDQNDKKALAMPASDLRGHVARLRHLVELVANLDDGYALAVARACQADAETLALAEFGEIPDDDD
jgi:hypothetical protein